MTNTVLREPSELVARLRGWQGEMPDALKDDLVKAADLIERLTPTLEPCNDAEELREERDALLERPISLAKMDSIDEDATDKMVAYYWWQQAQNTRAEPCRLREALVEARAFVECVGCGDSEEWAYKAAKCLVKIDAALSAPPKSVTEREEVTEDQVSNKENRP